MTTNSVIVSAFLFFAFANTALAQHHQARKQGFSMRMWINNVGAMGRVAIPPFRPAPNPSGDSLGLEYPVGHPFEHLYGGGLWIGGILDTTRGPGSNPPLRLVSLTFEGWAGPYFEMFPGSTPEDTLYSLHNATRWDTTVPAGWHAYWGGALPFRPVSDRDIYYTYTDTAAPVSQHIPLRLKIIQSSFAWAEQSGEAIIILEYRIMNMGPKRVDSVYVGLFMDADIGPLGTPQYWQRNCSGYYPQIRTAFTHNPVDVGATPVGLRLLGSSAAFERTTFRWFPGPTTPPNDPGKYRWLSSGVITPDECPNLSDTRFFLSVGPYFLRPSTDPTPDTLIVAFAVVSGLSLTEMYENAERADSLYGTFTTFVEPMTTTIPTGIVLHQNYPNPFNPKTVIPYHLPASRRTMLEVYDVLGRRVAILVDRDEPAGYHEVTFDATSLSSGIYFYKLTAGDFISLKKLVVVK